MAITTIQPLYKEWYTVNGESLATYGYALESTTIGTPERKGANVTSPIVHGDFFREKRFGQRIDSFNIWVCDADPETNVIPPTEAGKRAQFNKNLDYVNGIFNSLTPYGLKNGALEIKRYNIISLGTATYSSNTSTKVTFSCTAHGLSAGDKVSVSGATPEILNFESLVVDAVTTDSFTVVKTVGTISTNTAGTAYGTIERVAYGEVVSSYSIDDPRQFNYAIFSIEVVFPDPRWYDTASTSLLVTKGTNLSVGASTIGNAPVTDMVITITASGGSLVDPYLANSTLAQYPSGIGHTGTILSGDSVTINTSTMAVLKTVSGIPGNAISSLLRVGLRQDWMELYPSQTNTLSLQAGITSTGSGTASVVFTKAYI